MLENYAQAVELHNQKLAIACVIGSRDSESYALTGLGEAFIKLEQYSEASESLQQALEICRTTGNRSLEAGVLKNLAELHQKLGSTETALNYCEQALALATELGIPLAEECRKLKAELEIGGIGQA